MPALVDLLDQFFFSDAPGAQARQALVRGWELASGMTWDALYAQSLDDALSEELPHLSAYTGRNTPRPTRPELIKLLRADLGDAGNHLLQLDRNSGTFLTELARAMQAQRLVIINQHNLFTDEYRQILLNLFDHAHIRFKAVLSNHEPEFSAALASAAGYDAILIASISNFLERAFNASLPSLAASARASGEKSDIQETSPLPIMSFSESVPESSTFPVAHEPVATFDVQDTVHEAPAAQNATPRAATNHLRVLVATPADVMSERAQLLQLVSELDAQAHARFGLELVLVNPSPSEIASVASAAELADIFIGVVWLQFGGTSVETASATNATYFAGTEQDFGIALEQGSERNEGWLRTVVYRSIRPPLDLLHLNVAEYTRVQQFFERASAYGGEDLVRVYNESNELLMDARARLDAWMYNYAGDVANALSEYGKTSAVNGQTTDALTDFEQAISLYRELDRPELEMALWSQVGALHRTTGSREQAAQAFDAALRLALRLEDDDAAANALHETGLLAANNGDWRAAQRAYQQARTHLKPDAALYRTVIADEIAALTAYGDAERAANELDHAGDAYRDALALAQGIDDAGQTIALYSNLGQVAAQRGEYQAAIDSFTDALNHLDAYSSGETRRALYDEQADSFAQLAKLAQTADNLDDAEKSYNAALAADFQGNRQRIPEIEWLSALGEIAAKRQEWERALDAYGRALALLNTPADTAQRRALLLEQANAYQQLGDVRFGAQKLETAGGAYRAALEVYQELDSREQQGDVLTQLGAVSAAQSRWQEANAYFTQAIPRLDAPSSRDMRQRAQRAQAISLAHIGDEHRDAQQWGQAEIAYVQARGNLEQLGSSAETADLLVNLGIVTAAQARWQEALAFYQQARARLTAPEQSENYQYALRAEATTIRQLADLRRDAGDATQAQATYRQLLELAEQLNDSALEAEAFHQLGRVAAASARWDEAVDHYDQSLTRLEGSADDERAPIQRDQLAAYEKMGERERAALHFSQTEMAYRSALALAQGLSEREREAELLNTLGLVSIEQENWEEALVNLRRALGIYNLMPRAPEKSRVIWNIGRAQRGQKRTQLNAALARAQAIRLGGEFSEATADLETALQLSRELGDAHLEGIVLNDMGEVAAAEQNWDAALAAFDTALTKLTQDEDAERRTEIQLAQINALRHRSASLRESRQWAQADADLSIALEHARTLNASKLQGELVYESGLVAAGQARWNDAINLYSAALETLGQAHPLHPDIEGAQAEAYRSLGNSEANGQNWQGAEASFTQALTLQRNRGDVAAQAMLLTALGDVAMRQGEWRAAVDWLTQARPLTEQALPEHLSTLDDDLERALIASKRELQVQAETRGDTQRAAREFANAAVSYKQALAYADELQDKGAQAELNAKLGFIATERGEHQDALNYYRVAAGAYEAHENTAQRATLIELQAQTLQDLANRAGERGRWNDALALYQESIALLDAPSQVEQRNTSVRLSAITLQNLGDEARTNLDWNNALDAYRRAAGLFAILGAAENQRAVWVREADVLANMARSARSEKQYAASLETYQSAAELLTDAQDTTALSSLQAERVTVYREAGDFVGKSGNQSDAFTNYQAGFALAQTVRDWAAQADLLYQLGRVQAEQTQWESALAYYQAAYALTDAGTDPQVRATISSGIQKAHHILGDAQRAAGDLEHAQENYNGALSAALERDDRPAAGELYFILGMLAADTRAWDKALGNYAVALDHLQASDSSNRDDVVSYQTFAFQEWGDVQRGAGQFDAAADAYASALQRADELGDSERAGEVQYRRGLLEAARGDWQAALDLYTLAANRLPADAETRAALQNDVVFATRAVQRNQLEAQLQHAAYARQELQWDDAATAYRAALALTQQLDDTTARAKTEADLVSLYADKAAALRQQDLWDETNDAYRASLLMAREFNLDDQAHTVETNLVTLYADQAKLHYDEKKWDETAADYRTGLAVAREFELADEATTFEQKLVTLFADKARAMRNDKTWDEADKVYRQGIAVASEFNQDAQAQNLATNLATNYSEKAAPLREQSQWDETAQAYRAGLAVAQEFHLDDQAHTFETNLVTLYADQAALHRDEKRWDEAAASYRTGLSVAQEFNLEDYTQARESDLVALAQAKTAHYRAGGDLENAQAAAQEHLTLAAEFAQPTAEADALSELGRIAVAQGQWDTAHDYFERAQLLLATQARPDQLAALETDLAATNDRIERMAQLSQASENAQVALGTQNFAAATTAYRTAYDLARGLDDLDAVKTSRAGLLTTAFAQVTTLQTRADWTSAVTAAEDALATAREFDDLRAQADALYQLGTSAAAQTHWQDSKNYFEQSAALYESLEDNSRIADAQHQWNRADTILDRQARLATAITAAQTARENARWDIALAEYRNAYTLSNELEDETTAENLRAVMQAAAATQVNELRRNSDWANAELAANEQLALAREFQSPLAQANALMNLGGIAASQRRWETTLAHYDEAGTLFASLNETERVADVETATADATREWKMDQYAAAKARGELAFENERWREAEVAYTEGLELANVLNDTQRVGESQHALGNVATALKQFDTATERYGAALSSFASINNVALMAATQSKFVRAASAGGDKYGAQQDWDKAFAAYTLGLEHTDTSTTPAERGHLLEELGNVSVQQGNLSDAITYYERALAETTDRAPLQEKQGEAWQHIGDQRMDAHEPASAQAAYDHALALYTELDQPTHRAQVLHSIGLVRGEQGYMSDALEAHQEAYSLIHDFDVPAVRVEMLRSMGDAQRSLGQVEAARENYQKALPDADTPARGELEFALGEIAASQQHWQDALTHFAAAQTNLIQSDNTPHALAIQTAQADAHANLGEVLYGEGQWSEAKAAYASALALDAATGRTDRDGALQYQIGLTDAAQSDYVSAVASYDQAVSLLTGDELVLRDRILAQLAHALQQEGKRAQYAGEWAAAEAAFTRGRKMAEASDNFDQVADVWFRLGKIYSAQARHEQALAAYRRAYDYDRRDGSALLEREISDALATVLLSQGESALETQNYAQADETLRETLSFADRAENPQLLGSTLEALANTANARGETAEAIDLYARAGHTFAAIEDTDRWRIVSQQQANLLLQVAAQELDANEFADAENLYRRAWLLQQAAGDSSHDAETHYGLGRALLAQEKYADALAELEQADTLLDVNAPERKELKTLHADTLEALGAQSFAEARLDDAQQSFTRAATYRDELGQRARSGLNWQQLAEIAAQQNALDTAVDANEQALARLDMPETVDARRAVLHQQAQILAAMGDTEQNAGDWANASATYRRALAIAQEQGDLATIAQLYTLLASLAGVQEHWDDAHAEYQHALEVYEELDQPQEQAQTWTHLGDMHRQATQYAHATAAFQHARDLYNKTGNRLSEGAMMQRLGHVQGDREEWDAAIDEYQTALHLYNEIDARRIKPEVYRAMERAVRNAKLKSADQSAALGDASLNAGAYADAEQAYGDALELYAEADERILRAQMQNQIGVALEAQMRFDASLESYRDALIGFEHVGIPEAQVGVLANMGDVQRSRKLWNKAEAAYREALARNQTLDDPARAAELYNSLGMVREQQEDWDGALEHYQTAVNLYETAGMDDARMTTSEGLTRARRGSRYNAQAEYKRALEQALAAENFADAGELYNTLGLMAAEDKKYDEALDYYRQAVATFERLEATEDMDPIWRTAQGTVLNNIGDASQQIGAWHDADYAYTRALGLAREIGDRESEAILLSNLGIAAQEQAQLPRALDLNYQALDSYRMLGDETVRAELLERVGILQVQLGQPNAAETTFVEALETARATNDSDRIPRLLQQLGALAEGRGADEQALTYYDEALNRSIEQQRTQEQKALWKKQGMLYARSNQWEQAERAQNSALALANDQGDEPLQAELHTQLGQAAAARGDWRVALEHHQNALALYEKFEAAREQLELHERIGQAHAALGEYTAAEENYRAAVELAPDVPEFNTRALWQARADLAEKHNRWSDAASHYASASSALAADAAPETKIDLLFRRGDAAMHARDWHTADISYNDALELANVADNRIEYGLGMNRLGLLARAQRQNDDALEYFQEAIEILRQYEQPLSEAHVLNNIARLKLETNNAAEAELFSQAALAIAQALGSGMEVSNSLYVRGLIALEAQEFDLALRFLNQAIAANPANSAAQLQLGNTLLAVGNLTEAVQQAEASQGQAPDWELGAQTQLTIASLYNEDQRNFKTNLKRSRALQSAGSQQQSIAPEFLAAVESVIRAMEGDAENALAELNAANAQPARTVALDALRFARTALLALSKSPRRFKGKPTLVTYFTPPKPRSGKGTTARSRRQSDAPKSVPPPTGALDEPAVE